jgi:hypothetical protein
VKPQAKIGTAVTGALLVLTAMMAPTAAAQSDDDPVVHWNAVALNTVIADSAKSTPSAAVFYVADVQAAVYDATMAIEGGYRPYASSPSASPAASVEAAVATAAHDVLVHYFAAQRSSLDAAYAESLRGIPKGPREKGTSVGQKTAAAVISLRSGDGRFAAFPACPPDGTAPGDWRRTNLAAPCVTPWTAQVKPYLAESQSQFRPGGPLPLDSDEYARQFNETREFGVKASTPRTQRKRTAAQTEVATFWTENTVRQYHRALRGFATQRGLESFESARLFAMTALTSADAMITCWNTKYHYLFWRPVTAIHEAADDGNDETEEDPDWEPLSATANHPEYTSGHACLTGAISESLSEFLGTTSIGLTMDARRLDDSRIPTTTDHRFATVADLRLEVENARIYGGDHFRKGGADGTIAGAQLAAWALDRFFQAQPRRGGPPPGRPGRWR